MAQKFDNGSSEQGDRRISSTTLQDDESNKYRLACLHVHTLALGVALVSTFYHLILIYEDQRHKRYSLLLRNIPCFIFYALVVIGNRMYKKFLYIPYLILNFMTVIYLLTINTIRQYELRHNPVNINHVRRPLIFWITLMMIFTMAELVIFYIIYRDYNFVRDVKDHPPKAVNFIHNKQKIAVMEA